MESQDLYYYFHTPTLKEYCDAIEILSDNGYGLLLPVHYYEFYKEETAVCFSFKYKSKTSYSDLDYFKCYPKTYKQIPNKKSFIASIKSGKFQMKLRLG